MDRKTCFSQQQSCLCTRVTGLYGASLNSGPHVCMYVCMYVFTHVFNYRFLCTLLFVFFRCRCLLVRFQFSSHFSLKVIYVQTYTYRLFLHTQDVILNEKSTCVTVCVCSVLFSWFSFRCVLRAQTKNQFIFVVQKEVMYRHTHGVVVCNMQ